MCKQHGDENEKTPVETEIEQRAKSATPENNEDGSPDKDLEFATLNDRFFVFRRRGDGLEITWERDWTDLDWFLRMHRRLLELEEWEDFAVAKRGAKTAGRSDCLE